MKTRWLAPFLGIVALLAVAAQAEEKLRRIAFAIESQPVATALNEFARQAHLVVLRRDEDVSVGGMLAPRVEGELSSEEALKRLLSKTGLTFEFVNERTVRIARGSTPMGDPLGR